MAFGQFMASIDIHIVAASLNDVRAGLSAGPDEIRWAQTDNLMAELMVGTHFPWRGLPAMTGRQKPC
jgi:MFS transporter, DHA2 family, multidrug resistance protein